MGSQVKTKRGRPAYRPDNQSRRRVELMAGYAVPQATIASFRLAKLISLTPRFGRTLQPQPADASNVDRAACRRQREISAMTKHIEYSEYSPLATSTRELRSLGGQLHGLEFALSLLAARHAGADAAGHADPRLEQRRPIETRRARQDRRTARLDHAAGRAKSGMSASRRRHRRIDATTGCPARSRACRHIGLQARISGIR